MSDPLTALMHAVQVMNLLKTLIMKTLREREETATGLYSPMSSQSSGHQTEEDLYSHQEMDTSCELREPTSDYDDNDHANYSQSSEDEGEEEEEAESMTDVEECFLRQLDETKKDTNKILEQPGFNHESGISFTDSKRGNYTSSLTSDEDYSGASLTAMDQDINTERLSKGCENTNEVEMVDKFVESISPPSPSYVSNKSFLTTV